MQTTQTLIHILPWTALTTRVFLLHRHTLDTKTEMPVTLMKAAVLLSSSRLPQSLSLSGISSGHMSRLKESCS